MMPLQSFVGAFSFQYGGAAFSPNETPCQIQTISDTQLRACYTLPDGLRVIQSLTSYPAFDAVHWVLSFENDSENNSAMIEQLWDCDVRIPLQKAQPATPGYRVPKDTVMVNRTIGSNCCRDEFNCHTEPLPDGAHHTYTNEGGRSSSGLAPYFDVNQQQAGVLAAIGWTGQWQARFACEGDTVRICTGLEDAAFYMEPHEALRTSAILLLPYQNGQNAAHNQFRRCIKQHFSLVGQPGRPQHGPLCTSLWGAVPSDKMIDRITKIARDNVGVENIWIDAGWYGYSTGPCPNEFVGDWGSHTGSWTVNAAYHPDGLQQVTRAIHENGMKFVLWVEPERVIRGTDMPTQHPDWFLSLEGEGNLLINYGKEEAVQGVLAVLTDLIERLQVDVYRQDFNMDPLRYWRHADAPGRKGITEIRHIMGLYRLWDALLERFPHLLIDNCASGGRRIDIEMLKRSMPLWRSDFQCTYDADPETSQVHMGGFNWWLPYTGTGAGLVTNDWYHARSCYGASLTNNYWYMEQLDYDKCEAVDWVRSMFAEYKRVREYFEADFYPLTRMATDESALYAVQFDRPEQQDGIVLVFRREQCVCTEAELPMQGAVDCGYVFTDADTGDTLHLTQGALRVRMEQPRSSRLLYYKRG